SIHTIKGNCAFLSFPKLESIAHTSESLFARLRARSLLLTPNIINILLLSADTIRQILTNIKASGSEGEDDYANIIQTLSQLQTIKICEPSPLTTEQQTDLEVFPEIIPETANSNQLKSGNGDLDDWTLTASESSIRVNVGLLDQVMNLVGELVLVRNQVLKIAAFQEDAALITTCQRLDLITSELYQGVIKTRMQPISTITAKFPRVTRDLALECGKQIQMEMESLQTELDKSIIEAIKDPLTHIIRNCIDHGIEMPTERRARGKPIMGKIVFSAAHESGKVIIKISDDGSGIDIEYLKQKAQQMGLITAHQAEEMSESEAWNLIFYPGLTTTTQVTNISGRGVGMDVVKTNIENISGTVEVYSRLGQGTTFKLKIPLTLAIIPALVVTSGGDRFAIPQSNLSELVRLEGEALQAIEMVYDVPVYRLRGQLLPLVYLNQELGLLETTTQDAEIINIVVIQTDEYPFGLVVDTINDIQDIVVKPLGKQLKDVTTFAGATILDDGKVALIIDALGLVEHAGIYSEMQRLANAQAVTPPDNREMILILQAAQGTRMAVPFAVAKRLEEFPRSIVEKIGNQYIVQYRDQILSLIDLNTIFSTNGQQSPLIDNLATNVDDKIQVVVVTIDETRSIGLVVEEIVDIVEEDLSMKGIASRPGVKFLAVLQGKVTEILDVENIVRIANPYLLNNLIGATAPRINYG
ncbi:MAG: chemotaxis protein CheA, partial [Nostocaceae cyanobacterium]|nr:chemotaxis protein CheA [Nostocaceae cyanobacterium]